MDPPGSQVKYPPVFLLLQPQVSSYITQHFFGDEDSSSFSSLTILRGDPDEPFVKVYIPHRQLGELPNPHSSRIKQSDDELVAVIINAASQLIPLLFFEVLDSVFERPNISLLVFSYFSSLSGYYFMGDSKGILAENFAFVKGKRN